MSDNKAADLLPIVSLAFLFFVGLGMGASTTLDDFRKAFRTPKAVAIGFASQYLFMPVMAYLLALAFRVRNEIAVGAVLIGCSPGGTTSNLFTYWSNGDVALSVTMSFLSTVAAFALMPFWIWVLVSKALGSGAQVDWVTLVISLLLLILPTCAGLAIRKYNTEFKFSDKFLWKWVEILSSVCGAIFLVVTLVLSFIAYGNYFADAGWKVWVMCVLLQPLGCAFGYGVAKLLGMSQKHQRTISLETGIQNFGLTVSIIQLSFRSDVDTMEYALMFPFCYGILYLVWSPILVLLFRHQSSRSPPEEQEDDDEENDEPKSKERKELVVEQIQRSPPGPEPHNGYPSSAFVSTSLTSAQISGGDEKVKESSDV